MAGNGDAQRLEKLDHAIRSQSASSEPIEKATGEFNLVELALYLAAHGHDQEQLTREYAARLLETERRKMSYVEKIVGKLSPR